jgi:hypothetical protein
VSVVALTKQHTDHARGLDITFEQHTVVSRGETARKWRPSSSAFDVGFDSRTKDVNFHVTFLNGDMGQITYDMLPPEFEETVVRSVEYAGQQFSDSHRNSMRSGSSGTLTTSVTCQTHPHSSSGSVIIGLTNIMTANKQPLQSVEFKFQVECPQHGHGITPLGILCVVMGVFGALACAGGYAYNTNSTSRRGIRAVPLVPQAIALVRRKPVRFAVVDDVDEAYLLADEEIMATVSKDARPEYGAF